MKKEKTNMTKLQLTISLVLVLLMSVTSATYAYFAISATNNNTITGDAATVGLSLNVTRIYPKENSENNGVLVPQLSTSASATSPLANALKNGCIDGNQNVICHVYKVVLKNEGATATQVVDGKIFFFGNSALTTNISTVMPNLKWRLVNSVNETTASNSTLGTNPDNIASSTGTNIVSNLNVSLNETYTYYIIVWINETNEEQPVDTGKTFYGIVEFNSTNGTGITSTFT